MKLKLPLLFLFFLSFTSIFAQSSFLVKIDDGICYFHNVKIGHQVADVEKHLGKTELIGKEDDNLSTYFYPKYGLKLIFEGEYVRSIFLYPDKGSVMGDISKFHIFSRNEHTWKFKSLTLNDSQAQDVMEILGTENMNTKIGSGLTSAISNNVMGYKIVNSGGTQEIIFYYEGNEDHLEHLANRIGK